MGDIFFLWIIVLYIIYIIIHFMPESRNKCILFDLIVGLLYLSVMYVAICTLLDLGYKYLS